MLAMLNLSVMVSLRNLTQVAVYGWQAPCFFFVVAAIFLFPAALVSAELATGWSQTGGIYIWVKEAFGPGWGFFAVWMQWIHNTTWFPAILSFSGGALAYLINPALADNPYFLQTVILVGFWGFTFFNYFGLKTSAWFSTVGVIAGTVVPGLLLIALGAHWLAGGNPPAAPFSVDALVPKIGGIQDIVFIAGLFLAFGGLEVSAVHAREVQNPQKTFPRAILIAAATALILYVAGALSIAVLTDDFTLVSGVMEAFDLYFLKFNLGWAIYPIGLMIILGAVGELNAWIIGPVRALHATSQHGDLPTFFKKLNRHGVPSHILLVQAVVVTIASFAFPYMPTAGAAFWILTALSAQLYLLMYILMFFAAIKLRYSHHHVERTYRIPYHMPGIWFVGILGALSSILAFFLAFVPPSGVDVGNFWVYESILVSSIFIMCIIPYAIYKVRKING